MFTFRRGIAYYLQIKEDLLRRVYSGEFTPDARLPSEWQLATEYGVSRPTIRQAVAELVQEGLLVRHRGKGTFAARPPISTEADVFQSFAEEMQVRGIEHTARLVSAAELPASDSVARDLRIAPGDTVFEITRLRLGNGEPLVLRTLQVPARLCPSLLTYDMEDTPLYTLLRERFGLVASGSVQRFWAVNATRQEASLLGVAAGDPLLLWRGVTYSTDGKPIARTKALYRADRYRFEIRQGSMATRNRSPELEMVGVG
jgi:GntR family transcriptional regulator